MMVLLPDFPDTWKALSDEERHVATRRLAIDAAEVDVDDEQAMSQLRGIKLALTDPKTYLLAVAVRVSSSFQALLLSSVLSSSSAAPLLASLLSYVLLHYHSLLLTIPPIVSWPDRSCRHPELLPDAYSDRGVGPHPRALTLCTSIYLHGLLVFRSFAALRSHGKTLLVLLLPDTRHHYRFHRYVHVISLHTLGCRALAFITATAKGR